MKNYRTLIISLAVLALASCGKNTRIEGVVDGFADRQLTLRKLDVNVYKTVDTLKTDAGGAFRYALDLEEGKPEFFYVFSGDRRLAGLLLEKGEKAVVKADTLGNYSVTGSDGSAKLADIDRRYADFMSEMESVIDNPSALGRAYVKHYRESVRFVLENPFSLSVIPVLYEKVAEGSPVFSGINDAIIFRNAADSLKTVYPESPYVKALEKEAGARMARLQIDTRIKNAARAGFPDITLPDIRGKKVALSSVDAKAILLHFWDSTNDAQKMMNLDVLKPIYDQYHDKGLEIYAVGIDADKTNWARVVNAQKLPWINVNDGFGAMSPVVQLYGISTAPSTILIGNGDIMSNGVSDEASLRKALATILK